MWENQVPADSTKLEQQAKDYTTVIKACRAVSKCVGITKWGLTDLDSSVSEKHPGYGSALIIDRRSNKKPVFETVLEALA
jgi:endo-1,4-beta-xylanase